ncbi:MAG: hypothetical protein HeimC3_16540 [Candidatus Heimdallarchaeota archaeon LC_3]|nr:MAG: hypothetical protein HeimC3_16540 [Candidatus Heimdallarchaeota archaeon LC_3]
MIFYFVIYFPYIEKKARDERTRTLERNKTDSYVRMPLQKDPYKKKPSNIKGLSPKDWSLLKNKGLTREQAIDFINTSHSLEDAEKWLEEQNSA